LDVMRGKDQKAFGDAEYDFYITLDSDIVFSPEQFLELIKGLERHHVVSGMYMMGDNQHFAAVQDWDTDYFAKNGYFQFLTRDDIEQYTKTNESNPYMNVEYVGLGFFGCRKEVLDKMNYPYFWGDLQTIKLEDGTELVDQMSEDVAFCKGIKKAGFDILLDTRLRVGHEKSVVL
jgi:hypothetical protein